MDNHSQEIFRRLNEDPMIRDLLADMNAVRVGGKPLRISGYRYFQNKSGSMYCWSTSADTEHGLYWCWTYKAVGKGARSDKAKEWQRIDLTSRATRRAAKAEALSRFKAVYSLKKDAA